MIKIASVASPTDQNWVTVYSGDAISNYTDLYLSVGYGDGWNIYVPLLVGGIIAVPCYNSTNFSGVCRVEATTSYIRLKALWNGMNGNADKLRLFGKPKNV